MLPSYYKHSLHITVMNNIIKGSKQEFLGNFDLSSRSANAFRPNGSVGSYVA